MHAPPRLVLCSSLFACVALAAAGCESNARREAPRPEPTPAETESPREGDPEAPAARPRAKSPRPAKNDGPRVRFLKPRDGSKVEALPVTVRVEVDHRGPLRHCTLGGKQGQQVGQVVLDDGSDSEPAPEPSRGGGSASTEEDRTFRVIVEGGDDGHRAIARARVARKAIEAVLAEWTFSALQGQRRRAVVRAALGVLRNERFKERDPGKWRYTARVNMSEARNLVLDALEVEKTFGRDPYVLAACGGGAWWKGPAIDGDLRQIFTTNATDWLNRWRFRQAPAASDRTRLDRAVLDLGVQPGTAALRGFGASFQAPLVLAISGGVRFERFKAGSAQAESGFRGYLRTSALRCDVYDRGSNTLLASFTVKSDPSKRTALEATTSALHQPWVAQAGSVSEEAEKYAEAIGRAIASNVVRRLFDRFYPQQGQRSTPGGLECPGCGDLCEPQAKVCPTCQSPLRPASGAGPKPKGEALYRTTFRFVLPTARAGRNHLEAVAIDARGRKGKSSTTFTYVVPDVTPPVVKIVQPRGQTSTADPTIELVVEVSDDQRVAGVTVNGAALAKPKGAGRTAWTLRARLPLAEGENRFEVAATDGAGNVGKASVAVTYATPDVLPPTLNVLEPKAGVTVDKAELSVRALAKDDRGEVQVFVNKGALAKGAKDVFSGKVRLSPGANDLEFVARDAAGNQVRSVVRVQYVVPDTESPVIKLLGPAKGAAITKAPVIVAVTVTDNREVGKVTINGVKAAKDRQGRYRVRIERPVDGKNEIVVVALDAAGNRGKLTSTFSFDSTPPEVSGKAKLHATGKIDDLSATLTINGVKVDFDKKTGRYDAYVPPHPKHPSKLEIIATDAAGNVSKSYQTLR